MFYPSNYLFIYLFGHHSHYVSSILQIIYLFGHHSYYVSSTLQIIYLFGHHLYYISSTLSIPSTFILMMRLELVFMHPLDIGSICD